MGYIGRGFDTAKIEDGALEVRGDSRPTEDIQGAEQLTVFIHRPSDGLQLASAPVVKAATGSWTARLPLTWGPVFVKKDQTDAGTFSEGDELILLGLSTHNGSEQDPLVWAQAGVRLPWDSKVPNPAPNS